MAKTYIQQVAIGVLTRAHKIIPTEFLIVGRTGKWQLARRAKWIDGYNVFIIKENFLYPDEFVIEDFEYSPIETEHNGGQYNLAYKYWRTLLFTFSGLDVKAYIRDQTLGQRAFANLVGPQTKLGVVYKNNASTEFRPAVLTNPLRINKSDYLINIEVEVFSTQSTPQFNVFLWAVHGETIYYYDSNTQTWTESGATVVLVWTGFNANEYETHTFEDIPQPAAIPDGEDYQMILFMYDENILGALTETAYITSLKVFYADITNVPKKLKIRTLISETKRKPIDFESKFYNLPGIEGNTSIYASGILATGLDKYVSDVLDTTDSDQIIAPSALEYEGENGTLLVHLSDMVGQQHLTDRWRFDAEIMPSDVTPSAVFWATWDDFICELEASS
jgi:hypothetical protein